MTIDGKLADAIGRYAKLVVQSGRDPGEAVAGLQRVLEWARDVFPTYSPEMKAAVLKELRRRRSKRELGSGW